jgi:NAD+ kinase
MQPTRFGIVFDDQKPHAKEGAMRAAERLEAGGAKPLFEEDILTAQLVIVFGGDGLVMHTARRLAGKDAALLGVNYGRLGFLAEIHPEEVEGAINKCLAGEFRVETRILLEATLTREEKELVSGIAVNDVTLRGLYKSIDFGVFLDGSPTKAQGVRGDGVIVASPTGSTAYSFSAGGPIVAPEVPCLILTFVAPKFPSRSMILPDNSQVTIQLTSAPGPAAVTFDGDQITAAQVGDVLEVKRANATTRFASLREHSFLHRLQTRLNEGQF